MIKNVNIIAEFTKEDIKELIVDKLEKEGYKVHKEDINFVIEARTVGHQMQPYTENYLSKIEVKIDGNDD